MQIISRAEAASKGLKRYFTGKPCKNGHIAERAVNGKSSCFQCMAEWNKAHPEKGRERQRRHRAKFPRPRKTEDLRRRKRATQPLSVTRAQYYQKHKEKYQAINRAWGKAHLELRRAMVAYRRARERRPTWVDQKALRQTYLTCPPDHHIDHIVPLGGKKRTALTAEGYPISGLHVPWNLRPLPGLDNQRKLYRMLPEDQALCET